MIKVFTATLLMALISLCSAPALSTNQATCNLAEHRQFDFWIGEWVVTNKDGKLAGHNRITREYNNCALREVYTTPRGYKGESLNIYQPSTQLWYQTWVDNTGLMLQLKGKFTDGKMKLEGSTLDINGNTIFHRITWSLQADGSVRQHWQSRKTESQWKTAFEGIYKKQN